LSDDILVFVSCGQQTTEEKKLGNRICELVNAASGFQAYYAEDVHNLEALTNNIFKHLQECSALIAVLHNRGVVSEAAASNPRVTSSMWINQEVAVLAFRQFVESTGFPILIFKQKSVSLEGTLASLIANPIEFETNELIESMIQNWLVEQTFPPNSRHTQEAFREKVGQLEPSDWKVIECLFALGQSEVTDGEIKDRLRQHHKMEKDNASKILSEAKTRFAQTNLVQLHGSGPAGHTMSVHQSWRWLLKRELQEMSNQSQ